MEQQAWKRELDASTEDGEKKKPKRGKPKAKAKGKAKSKAKKSNEGKKGSGKGNQGKKKGKAQEKEQTEENTGDDKAEDEAIKKTKTRKRKTTTEKTETPADLVTPPPKASKSKGGVHEERSKEKEAKEGRVKKTFARRYRPKTPWGAAQWDALRAAWVAVVTIQLAAPSTLEAICFKSHTPIGLKFVVNFLLYDSSVA